MMKEEIWVEAKPLHDLDGFNLEVGNLYSILGQGRLIHLVSFLLVSLFSLQ